MSEIIEDSRIHEAYFRPGAPILVAYREGTTWPKENVFGVGQMLSVQNDDTTDLYITIYTNDFGTIELRVTALCTVCVNSYPFKKIDVPTTTAKYQILIFGQK